MSEAIDSDLGHGATHRPACDNCKARKTKCDRNSPCSSCVALKIVCRVSHRPQEKKQRVLLSTRYEEAVENINHQLRDVTAALDSLRDEVRSGKSKDDNLQCNRSEAQEIYSTSAGQVLAAAYSGESSFHAHAQAVTRDLASLHSAGWPSHSPTPSSAVWELLRDIDTPSSPAVESGVRTPQQTRAEWQNMALPPTGFVVKLLRLAKVEKQRFFAHVPLFEEEEFANLCKKVYFAIDSYTLSNWIVVNTGLAMLLEGLESRHLTALQTDAEAIQQLVNILTLNAITGWQCAGLGAEPDVEMCRSLALFGTFCIRSGRSREAWRSISAASRMCLDLGMHRIPGSRNDPETTRQRLLFWHVYTMEIGLAFTNGKTPTIRTFEVSSARPSLPNDMPDIPAWVSSGFLDFATVEAEIHAQLFSAAGLQDPLNVRDTNAKSLVIKLHHIQASLKQSSQQETVHDRTKQVAVMLLDIVMFCLLTVVYRTLPPRDPNPHPLQCCDECIDAARKALLSLVEIEERKLIRDTTSWHNFLNLALSLVPFVAFLVIAGNVIVTASSLDLSLLKSTLTALESAAGESQTIHRLHAVCSKFFQIAVIIHDQQKHSGAFQGQIRSQNRAVPLENPMFPMPLDSVKMFSSNYPMLQQDWDGTLENFNLEFGDINAGEMAAFVEPYINLGPFS